MKGINYNRGTFLNYPIRAFINENINLKKKSTKKSKDIKINNYDKIINNTHIIDVIEKNSKTIPLKKSALINYILHMDNLIEKLYKATNYNHLNAKLIYKATREGDKIENFSDKFGNIKNTLIIIKTVNNLNFWGIYKRNMGKCSY